MSETPRAITARTRECQALDASDVKCRRRRDVRAYQYHGDGEIYDSNWPMPRWVRVYLCAIHRPYQPKWRKRTKP